jgi:hypothetical protein
MLLRLAVDRRSRHESKSALMPQECHLQSLLSLPLQVLAVVDLTWV